jgi:hypothetical protein
MSRHPKLTIKLTELRQDEEFLAKLERYAMQRHTTAWAQRYVSAAHMHFADTCFAAAERCARLARIIATQA